MKVHDASNSQGKVLFEVDNNISYQTLDAKSGPGVALTTKVVPRKPPDSTSVVVPISNLPAEDDNSPDTDGIPSKRDFTVYRLKRQIAALRENEKQLLGKLTRCQEVLASEKRYLEIGLTYDQWETYGELMQRKARLTGTLELISDGSADPQILTPEEFKRKKLKI